MRHASLVRPLSRILTSSRCFVGAVLFFCFSVVFLENWFFAHWYWFDNRSNFWHPQYPTNLLDSRKKRNNAALRSENREFKICTITFSFPTYFLPPIRCGDVLICNHIWPWNSSWQCDFTLDKRMAQSTLLQLVTCFFVMHIAFWNLSHLEQKSMHQLVLHGTPKISVRNKVSLQEHSGTIIFVFGQICGILLKKTFEKIVLLVSHPSGWIYRKVYLYLVFDIADDVIMQKRWHSTSTWLESYHVFIALLSFKTCGWDNSPWIWYPAKNKCVAGFTPVRSTSSNAGDFFNFFTKDLGVHSTKTSAEKNIWWQFCCFFSVGFSLTTPYRWAVV